MFVRSNNCREIYNYNFINNKELPKGNKSERLVYLTLQLFDNPKGNSVYKQIFEMSNEKKFVTKNTIGIQVTPAQQHLLQLISHIESEDIYTSLKTVHYLGTYCADKEMVDLQHSATVHTLLDAIHDIKQEHLIHKLNTNTSLI